MIITETILQEFKGRMHLDDEDENLKRILNASVDDLRRVCGDYDINTHEVFKELVFERSRYVYNDALEYFYTNFSSHINSLSVEKAIESNQEEENSDATI